MSKTPKKPPEPHDDSVDRGAERALMTGAALLADWNYSLAGFTLQRMQKYWQLPFDLARLSSLDQIAQVQQAFEAQLMADYADQAEKLWQIARGEPRKSPGAPSQDYESGILRAQKDAALIIEQAKAQAQRIIEAARSHAEQPILEAEPEVAAEVRRKSA